MHRRGQLSNNRYVERHTTYRGMGGRPGVVQKVSSSLGCLCMAPFLLFIGCSLLWFNEKWAIKTHRSLNEALEAHTTIWDAERLEPAKEGRLVHLSGMVSVDQSAHDDVLGLETTCAVSLKRQVEIYQWVERHTKKKHKLPNGATEVEDVYDYHKQWNSNTVSSRGFRQERGHENVGVLPFSSQTFRSLGPVHLGAYDLAPILTQKITRYSPISAVNVKNIPPGGALYEDDIYLPIQAIDSNNSPENLEAAQNNLDSNIDKKIVTIDGEDKILYTVKSTGEQFSSLKAAQNSILVEKRVIKMDGEDRITYIVKSTGDQFSSMERALDAAVQVPQVKQPQVKQPQVRQPQVRQPQQQAKTIIGSITPQIGDVRVKFSEIKCTTVSVLAKLREGGKLLDSWPSQQGPGYDIAMLKRGQIAATEMISQGQAMNHFLLWLRRLGGFLLTYVGYSMITQVLTTTADITLNWIPLLGPMTVSIISLGVTVANFVLAITSTVLVAGISWIFYRPVLGATLLACALGLFFLASRVGDKKKKNSADYRKER